MVKFDLMQSSPLSRPVANDAFLANLANWQTANIREISAKILEVDLVCRAINKKFNVQARL